MEQIDLINRAARLLNVASERQGKGDPVGAQGYLVELWRMLNEQRELEAGGDAETTEPDESEDHDDI